MRERGGEADQGKDGLKILRNAFTQLLLRPDAGRKIELPSEELSLTPRAGRHLLPDDDDYRKLS